MDGTVRAQDGVEDPSHHAKRVRRRRAERDRDAQRRQRPGAPIDPKGRKSWEKGMDPPFRAETVGV